MQVTMERVYFVVQGYFKHPGRAEEKPVTLYAVTFERLCVFQTW